MTETEESISVGTIAGFVAGGSVIALLLLLVVATVVTVKVRHSLKRKNADE
jgi:hypothetical protein